MKRLLPILILVLFAPMARATAAFNAEIGRYNYSGTQTTDAMVISNTVAVGLQLMVPAVIEANSKTISSITDTGGNTYTKIGATNGLTVHNVEMWTAYITTALQVGDTITIHLSSAEDTVRGYILWTLSGIKSSSSVDVQFVGTSGFVDTVTNQISPTIDGDAIAGALVIQGNHTFTLTNGTQIGSQLLVGHNPPGTQGLFLSTWYQIQTSHAPYNPNGSNVPTDTALLILLALKASVTHTYYVDFVGGTDSLAGTATGTAWKHCPGDTNATSTASTTALVAGDTVIFKGGVSYIGDIAIKVAGSSGLPIFYDGTGNSWGSGLAQIDLNNTYYHAFSATSAKDFIWIKGFDIYHGKNKSSKSNQTVDRAGSTVTGVNYGGDNNIDSEGDIFNNGGDFWWISDGRIHDNENCYDLSVQFAETDSDSQTDLNVPCDKKAVKLYNNANNCVISNMVCWATGRDIFGLQGTTNTLVVDCNGGGDSNVTTNKGWFAVFARLTGSGVGAPTSFITFLRDTVHEGWQYQGDDAGQRSHAGDWFHSFGDADGVLEADTDTHDILFDRVYCYNDHQFIHNNGTSTFFIESDCYNYEWRNCLLINDFADCIEMRDCSNMVVNATTIISGNTQPLTYKSKVNFAPKAIKVRNSLFITQSSNSAEVSIGTSSTGYDGDLVDSDYNVFYHPNNGGTHMVYWAGTYYTLAAWRTFSGNDTHSVDADPKLVSLPSGSGWASASSGDYRANSSQSSPLIGAGVDQSSTFTIFRDGTSRTVPWIIGSETSFAGGGGGGGGSPAFSISGSINLQGISIR